MTNARANPHPDASQTLDRRARTIMLLESRLDWHPAGRDSVASLQATAKPGVGAWVRCTRCAGAGRVVGLGVAAKPCRGAHHRWPYGHGCRPCVVCEDGWVHTDGEGGSDRMLAPGKHELHTAAIEKLERAEQRARDEEALVAQLARPSQSLADDLAATRPERWERERDRHMAAGSYRELDLALEWLGDVSLLGRRLVEWCYEFRIVRLVMLRPEVTAAAELAVDLAASRMPDPVRVPPWLMPRERFRSEARRSRIVV